MERNRRDLEAEAHQQEQDRRGAGHIVRQTGRSRRRMRIFRIPSNDVVPVIP